ncbi:hypothetical protein TNCT_131221 [Trichonephila clavata]|uniref:Uncharacterized protein n=1 Tax=Trichonephila clavata TaxID=2740835 RepID=A0A8X6FN24_TRICU|nr:hypothetical protein TNCT_131221 [Trichonephila clavata]
MEVKKNLSVLWQSNSTTKSLLTLQIKCLWIRSKILQAVEKSIFSPIDERSGQLMDCVLRTQTSKNLVLDFIVTSCRSLDGVRKAQRRVSKP